MNKKDAHRLTLILITIGVLLGVAMILMLTVPGAGRQGRAGYWPVYSWSTPTPTPAPVDCSDIRADGRRPWSCGACYTPYSCYVEREEECPVDDPYSVWEWADCADYPYDEDLGRHTTVGEIRSISGEGETATEAWQNLYQEYDARHAEWSDDYSCQGVTQKISQDEFGTFIAVQYFHCIPYSDLYSPSPSPVS